MTTELENIHIHKICMCKLSQEKIANKYRLARMCSTC